MLAQWYRRRLHGALSYCDRSVITGTLQRVCCAASMTSLLNANAIRMLDYARFAEPLHERIRARAQNLSDEQGATAEFVAEAPIRKEDVMAKVMTARGDHPALVHVISAMEAFFILRLISLLPTQFFNHATERVACGQCSGYSQAASLGS